MNADLADICELTLKTTKNNPRKFAKFSFIRVLFFMEKIQLVQITRQSKISEEDFALMINEIYEKIWQNLLPPQILTEDLTSKLSNNLITPNDAPIPDCQTCGACCAALPCVGVRPNEQVADEDYWDVVINNEIVVDRFVRRDSENFACVALDGTIGEDVSCRIYENRPKMCHLFEAGSDKCHALRRIYGFEPFLTLMEMSEAVRKIDAQPQKKVDSEAITNVKFSEDGENVKITVTLNDKTTQTLHIFNPDNETWRQFEFDGLTLSEAKDLTASRIQSEASLY